MRLGPQTQRTSTVYRCCLQLVVGCNLNKICNPKINRKNTDSGNILAIDVCLEGDELCLQTLQLTFVVSLHSTHDLNGSWLLL